MNNLTPKILNQLIYLSATDYSDPNDIRFSNDLYKRIDLWLATETVEQPEKWYDNCFRKIGHWEEWVNYFNELVKLEQQN